MSEVTLYLSEGFCAALLDRDGAQLDPPRQRVHPVPCIQPSGLIV
jgi:hypothetical protein